MSWTLTAQIVAIVAVYVGGILGIGHFITHSLGKRMDDMKSKIDSDHVLFVNAINKRIDDLDTSLNKRIDDLDISLNRRMDALDKRVDALDKRMDALDIRMDALDKRMDALDRRMDGIGERMDALNQNFVRHLEFHADKEKVDS